MRCSTSCSESVVILGACPWMCFVPPSVSMIRNQHFIAAPSSPDSIRKTDRRIIMRSKDRSPEIGNPWLWATMIPFLGVLIGVVIGSALGIAMYAVDRGSPPESLFGALFVGVYLVVRVVISLLFCYLTVLLMLFAIISAIRAIGIPAKISTVRSFVITWGVSLSVGVFLEPFVTAGFAGQLEQASYWELRASTALLSSLSALSLLAAAILITVCKARFHSDRAD